MAKKGKASDLAPNPDDGRKSAVVEWWLSEIAACRKREKDFRKNGARIRDIYSGKKSDSTPFNICFSNTETIAPALYSQVPRPVVQRRYKDADPMGLAAAKAGQRLLEFLLDTNIEGYETFDECMKGATLDGLLPGRGATSVKYDADVADVADGEGTIPVKKSELVCPEKRSWDRVYFGYARTWSKVPWVAYEEHIDRAEALRLFGPDKTAKIAFAKGENADADDESTLRDSSGDERNTGGRKTALIYQIWDKNGGKKIRYISPQYKDGYLKVESDSLKLTGFYNCPRPLEFIDKTDDLVPTAPYILYENQATELNSLTVRINRIVKAIKARGVYDSELGTDIQNLMEADDNELVPADKSSSLAAEKGLQNAIWFMPLEMLVATLRELVSAREACKQVIYEVTGISDIIRGASKASETLGAQQIKSQWGTLRIKPKQAEVQRYARDLLRMMLEIAAQKFSEDTWARMTGLPYLTEPQVEKGQLAIQANQKAIADAQSQQQRMAKLVPAQTPEQQMAMQANQQQMQQAQQNLQQAQASMQAPQWSQVIKILRDDLQRAYRIDIETNSTVEPEAVEDQKNISDLMTAMGQFLNGVGPMVAQGIMPFETAQTMLMAITRRFRFGDDIEDQIRQMQAPKPQDNGDSAKLQQMQGQMQQQQAETSKREIEHKSSLADMSTQLASARAENMARDRAKQLDDKQTATDLDRIKLADEQKQFKLAQSAHAESITNRSAVENTKLDARKQVSALEQKGAKTEQVVAKQLDTKMADAVKSMGELVNQLAQMQASLIQTVGEQAVQTKELIKAVAAPRVSRHVRGKDGRIEQTVQEVSQ